MNWENIKYFEEYLKEKELAEEKEEKEEK